MLCIYCDEREADAREHPLPQALGGFSNYQPLRDRICQPCNEEISKAELEFCRLSPEAVLRNTEWVKRGGKQKSAASPFMPRTIGGKHLVFSPETRNPGTHSCGSQTRLLEALNLFRSS
jgi:hypothetical protein